MTQAVILTATTIQVTPRMARILAAMKLHPRETYNDVLERLLEDLAELNDRTKRDIEQAVRAIKAGRSKTHEQVRAEMGF